MSTYEDLLGEDDNDFELVVGDGEDTLGEVATEILGEGAGDGDFELVVGDSDESGLDPWLHKLNPSYWLKSSREKEFIDADKKRGKELESLRKRRGEQEKELSSAQKAFYTAQAAKQAEQESAAIEQQLQDIQQSVSSGAFVGSDEEAAPVAAAAEKGAKVATKNKFACKILNKKLESGEKLTADEMSVLRRCLKTCKQLRALHNTLHEKVSGEDLMGYRTSKPAPKGSPSSDFLGENVQEILGESDMMGKAAAPISKKQWTEMTAISATQPGKLGSYLKRNKISLSPSRKNHLKNMTILTRKLMVKKGMVSGDETGSAFGKLAAGFGKVAAVAALPVAALAYGMYKGTKWAGKKVFGKKGGGSSPQSQRAARIKAARARRLAALRRAQAAAAESDAARQELEAQAAAADAEAAAASAESQAQTDDADAEAAQYQPGDGGDDGSDADADADSSGSFVGSFVGVSPNAFIGSFVGDITDPKAKQIVEHASKNTPIGHKIRAGAAVYKAAKKGDPKAKIAIAKISHKAKAGNPQAKRDLNAIKAGKVALHATGKAKAKINARAKADGRVGVHRKLEVAAADKLAKFSRRSQLHAAAKIERRAACGDKKAQLVVKKAVVAAKKGNPHAKAAVAAMQLSRRVRTQVKTPQEARRVKVAHKLVKAANAGHPKAVKQVKVIQAAAKAGNPNAKRAVKRLQLAAAVEKTVSTGKVVKVSKPVDPKVADKAALSHYGGRVKAGVASREEALAAAKAAQRLGLREQAASLALQARSLRPASEGLKNAATMAAAAQGGNPEAQKVVQSALEEAQAGNPAGINSAGNLAAVQALHAVNNGMPMSPEMAEATGIAQRARAGDPEAKRIVQRVSEGAQSGNAGAVKAAIALTGASAVLAAVATRPGAHKQWVSKAAESRGQKLAPSEVKATQAEFAELYAKVQHGTATRAEAERARQLAMALGKPSLAAEISAMMPPLDTDVLTSLPDVPLPAITGPVSLIKESLKALFLATPDPLANYREGVQSRGATSLLPEGVTPPPAGRKKG